MTTDSASDRPVFRILCIAGARPNFIKLAPLFRAFSRFPGLTPTLVHTGQHYDDQMSGQFFRDLELPPPAHNLEVGSGSHAQQTAEIIKRFEPVVLQHNPHAVLVVGDVNSTAACALVAKKLGIFVIHGEAGLRSFDRSMPEEINRLITDVISDLLLVTEESGVRNLKREGVAPEKICFVGNLMIDSLYLHLERSRNSHILDELGLRNQRFGLVTLHRPANVDDPEQLQQLLSALQVIAQEIPLCFPAHPRTQARLDGRGLSPHIRLLDPLSYPDFVCLMSHSAVVFTDSGGVQEETTALGIPCLTLRSTTERPVTVEEGTNRLAGITSESILAAWHDLRANPTQGRVPELWDGKAAERSVQAIYTALRAIHHGKSS
ncbi:MAG TPA: UDP-N-acetylglucosamine 2-epimerase (non-hydrolyzing) [Candidatus Angelobacter sp.]|nr:UDP-N-acetylglucosamine 2-epimerase (non-hydrolyzing) [Candidatus Angelobacter sp.]